MPISTCSYLMVFYYSHTHLQCKATDNCFTILVLYCSLHSRTIIIWKSHWIIMVKVEPFHNSKYMYKQENHRTQARKGYDE